MILVGILKEAIVEVGRWKDDNQVNSEKCIRYKSLADKETITVDCVEVGDVLELHDG